MSENVFKYFAFISYKREDEKWAKRLQNKLETYKLPSLIRKERIDIPSTLKPIFRDKTDLNGVPLEKQLQSELERSKYLIVICSPNAVKSNWVNKEIEHFIALGRCDRIIPYIVKGNPDKGDIIQQCLPQALLDLKKQGEELLAINLPENKERRAFIQLVSTILDLDFDKLWQRDRIRKRRKQRIRIFGIYIPLFIFFLLMTLSMLSVTAFSYLTKTKEQLEQGNHIGAQLLLQKAEQSFWPLSKEVIPSFKKRSVYRSPLLSYATVQQNASILSVKFNLKGDRFATLGENNEIRIWRTCNAELVGVVNYENHRRVFKTRKNKMTIQWDDNYTHSPIQAMTMCNDSSRLIGYHENHSVSIYDYARDSILRCFKLPFPYLNNPDLKIDVFVDSNNVNGYVQCQLTHYNAMKEIEYIEINSIPFKVDDALYQYKSNLDNIVLQGFIDGSQAVYRRDQHLLYRDKNEHLLVDLPLPLDPEEIPVSIHKSQHYLCLLTSQNRMFPVNLAIPEVKPAIRLASTPYTLNFTQRQDEFIMTDHQGMLSRFALPTGEIVKQTALGNIIDRSYLSGDEQEIYLSALPNCPFIGVFNYSTFFPVDRIMYLHNAYVSGFVYHPASQHLITYFKDGIAKIYPKKYNNLPKQYQLFVAGRNRLLELSPEDQVAFYTCDSLDKNESHTIYMFNPENGEYIDYIETNNKPRGVRLVAERKVFYLVTQTALEIYDYHRDPKDLFYLPKKSTDLPENLISFYFTPDTKHVMFLSRYIPKDTLSRVIDQPGTLVTIVKLDSLKVQKEFVMTDKVEFATVNNELTFGYFVLQGSRELRSFDIEQECYTWDIAVPLNEKYETSLTMFDVDTENSEYPFYICAGGEYKEWPTGITVNNILTGQQENIFWCGPFNFNYIKYDHAHRQIIGARTNGEVSVWKIFSKNEVDSLFRQQVGERQLRSEEENEYGIGYWNSINQ